MSDDTHPQGCGGETPEPGGASVSPRAERIVAEAGAALEEGLLPAQVFNDPDVYEAELRRIFGRCWTFVGHETEIPDPGDYVKRYIGEDPFILVRDERGEVNVLFDSCRHHGSSVCKTEAGNTSHFRCPYHGWTYRNDGELAGIPQRETGFEGLDAEEWGLLSAPRVQSYEGLVFASLAEDGPTLEEYMGDFRWYIDVQIKLAKGGMEVVGEPHRWVTDSDWKSGADNFSADSYHTAYTHRSVLEVGFGSADFSGEGGKHRQTHVTHVDSGSISLRMVDPEREVFFGYPEEYVTDEHLTEEQYEVAAASGVNTATMFPNFSFLSIAATHDPTEELTGFFTIRQWQPKGPGEMEIWSWVLAPAAAPEEYKRRAYKAANGTFSPSGNYEQDDIAVWEGIAETGNSVFAEKRDLKLNYQMGGQVGEAAVDEEWDAPGTAWTTNLEEGTCRTFHGNWYKAMSGDEVGMRYPGDHV